MSQVYLSPSAAGSGGGPDVTPDVTPEVTADNVPRGPSRGERPRGPSRGERLTNRIAALREAVRLGGERFPPEVAAAATADLDHIEARLALGVDRTVVALVGGTGSGKSSLFNAISRLGFADVGVRRPTTSHAAACVWGGRADGLLDFLQVHPDRRIQRESVLDGHAEEALGGLVLLDLPDHDSIAPEHAQLVDRLLPLVDLLVWVVDPQKYADNALHERYLQVMVDRQDAMLVLINQVDTVPASAVDRIAADIARLLEGDGLHDVQVLATSVATGSGIRAVRALLADVVVGESMAAWTADVEISGVAVRLGAHVGPAEPHDDDAASQAIARLVPACGIDAIQAAIRTAVASPRRSLALVRPGAPALAAAASVRQQWVRAASQGLPPLWHAEVDGAVGSPERLRDALAGELDRVDLPSTDADGPGRWFALAALVLGVAGLSAGLATGVGPMIGIGTALLILGVALSGLDVRLRRRASVRRAEGFASAARAAVEDAVREVLVEPAARVLSEHRAVLEALGRGRAPASTAPPQVTS